MNDFDYLAKDQIYLDSACQSLRPRPVIDALTDYYTHYNSCGERVKYKWGKITDEKVDQTRAQILKYLRLKPRDHIVSFTLNTTYGINLLLDQIRLSFVKKVVTTDIEHNSPFLSTIAFARKHTYTGKAKMEREVIDRNPDGSVPLDATDWTRALLVLNCASNIDGRELGNVKDLIKTVHKHDGIVIIDAAQAMAHGSSLLHKTEADAICFSAHKMYAPSLGVIVARRDLLPKIDTTFIDGGMVDDADREAYTLSATDSSHAHTKFESGLQAWGEIIALGRAIEWLQDLPSSAHATLKQNTEALYDFLVNHPKIHLIGSKPSPTMSFHVESLDSHLLGEALSRESIMARTGYFCCHYYLDHVKHYPPLVRLSLSYATRASDIAKVISVLSKLLNT